MPRPPRCRRICSAPQVDTFCPNGCEDTEPILLTLDEYEVIRLVDLEQQTHEQCAAQMDISRSTVQEIYEVARRKIAACLVHGKSLHITGGNYRICGGQEATRCGRCCWMQRTNTEKSNKKCKGDSIMKRVHSYTAATTNALECCLFFPVKSAPIFSPRKGEKSHCSGYIRANYACFLPPV